MPALTSAFMDSFRKQVLLLISFPLFLTPSTGQEIYRDFSLSSGINHTGPNLGLAIADYDGDGDEDVYISREKAPNLLYQNLGNQTFEEVSQEAGVADPGTSHCSVWGDFDNDGLPDLYVCNRGEANSLYHNQGDGTFKEIGQSARVNALRDPRSVSLADVDGDGWLDIYVANLRQENILYRNNGDLTFSDITLSARVSDRLISMGTVFFDYDNDGDQDLYLTHDANQPNILYQNDGTGKFLNVSAFSGTDYAGFGMGVDVADVNRDGWLDIYITNLYYNTLLLNQQDGTFKDISESAGVHDIGMGWGTAFLDFDNDGWVDIYVANDSYFSPLPNVLYRNRGDLTFEIVEKNEAISSMYAGYGLGCFDLDLDGKIDIALANRGNDGNQLFRNESAVSGNWIQLKATGAESNRMAIGTRISLEANGILFTDEINAGTGYASQNSPTLHFGLGKIDKIDLLTVRWPNGEIEMAQNLGVNRLYRLEEGTVGWEDEPIDLSVVVAPNPSEDVVNIQLNNPEAAFVDIRVLDLRGREILRVWKGDMEMGTHSFLLEAGSIPVGRYVLMARIGDSLETKKFEYRR